MNNNPQLVIIAVLAVLITGVADVILILSGKEMAEVVGGTWVEFWAIFATVWNLVIIAFAKYAGDRFLHRSPDYYTEANDE
jgi:hypothetical protein